MERNDLVRLRWRLTGAWQWPSLIVLTWVDGLLIHLLPPEGDSQSFVGGLLIGLVLNLLSLVLIGPPLSLIIRRTRDGMPWTIARNYGSTFGVCIVTVSLLIGGIAHHATIDTDRTAMYNASQRAEAWLGDHAPARFMANIHHLDTLPIQSPQIYRSCVRDATGTENFCVTVDLSKPFGQGVTKSGYESNELLNQGAN